MPAGSCFAHSCSIHIEHRKTKWRTTFPPNLTLPIAILKGGWCEKAVHKVVWMSPPSFLKLNFDGSFLNSIGRSGIGGIIRDWNGKVVRNFSEPVDTSDANEVEAFALLVGPWLLRLGGYKVHVEGDPFQLFRGGQGSLLILGGLRPR